MDRSHDPPRPDLASLVEDGSRPRGFRSRWAAALLIGVALGACGGEPPLQPAPPEHMVVVPGVPWVREAIGAVDRDEGRGDGSIRPSRPRICERSQAPRPPNALDVLLVLDVGRSMEGRRPALIETIPPFLDSLAGVGYLRVGILPATAGTDGEGLGRLVPIPGAPVPYVSCSAGAPRLCNVGDGSWESARQAFLEAVDRVPSGPASLGLLAITEALTGRLQENGAFLRDEADLHVVVISDADDVSCNPRLHGADGPCHSFEGCACPEEPGFGGVEWYVRALRGLKGHGFEERVRLSAWVATAAEPLRFPGEEEFRVGCTTVPGLDCAGPGEEGAPCALAAPRYAAVARALAGGVWDLCAEAGGLLEIGAQAGGALADLPLARKALPLTIETVLLSLPEKSCNHLVPCSEEGLDCIRGRCGQVVLEGGTNGWQYVSCSNGIPRNLVRFGDPDRLQHRNIEICYDVDVGADPSFCP